MKKNMGGADRIIRLVVAAVLVALSYFKVVEGNVATVFYVIAGIVALTSIINFCPLYTLFGLNTCKVKLDS